MTLLSLISLSTVVGLSPVQAGERIPPPGQAGERAQAPRDTTQKEMRRPVIIDDEEPVKLSMFAEPQQNANMKMQVAPASPICFFASYGDNNQAFDNASNSIDKFTSFPPTLWTVAPYANITTNTDLLMVNRVWSYSLYNYPRFNPKRVADGKLKLDVYLTTTDPLWGNDSITTWDDNRKWGIPVIKSGEYNGLLRPVLDRFKSLKPHWVSIVCDLSPTATGGGVYVYAIDSFGNPIPGKYYGLIKRLTPGERFAICDAASDGDLQGVLQDDTPLSYVELVIRSEG